MRVTNAVRGRLKAVSGEDRNAVTTQVNLVFSEDQQIAYDALVAWSQTPSNLLRLGGLAGSGKSSLTGVLGRHLSKEGIDVAYCTYTGKASLVLRNKLRQSGVVPSYCGTIHRLIYQPIRDEDGELDWQLRPELPYDLIVIDEASMVGRDLFEDLNSYGIPILAVGDHGQLPPVGADSFSLVQVPDIRLEKIHRQAAGNPILALAHFVRQTGTFRGFQSKDDRVQFVRSLREDIRDFYGDGDLFDVGSIAYTNQERISLNAMARSARKFEGPPQQGDIVICLKNAYFEEGMIANGSRGFLLSVKVQQDPILQVKIAFPDDGFIYEGEMNGAQFNRKDLFTADTLRDQFPNRKIRRCEDFGLLCDFGYAMTCHKAQGSQFHTVLVDSYVPHMVDEDTATRWYYTAFTRAAEQLVVRV